MATTEVQAAQQRAVALSMFRQWIINALLSKSRGDGTAYWRLIQEIGQIHADPAKLRVFSQCVSYFDPDVHEALLIQLLGVSLWTCNADVAAAIIDLCINLASANSACLPVALDILVRNLMPPSCGVPAFMGAHPPKLPASAHPGAPGGAGGAVAAIVAAKARKGEELRRQGEMLRWVVDATSRICRLVPTASSRLLPLLLQRMPHKRVDKEFQCVYVAGMFALAEAEEGETVRDSILAAVVDHLIQIDVEIRWEDISTDAAVVATTNAPDSGHTAEAAAAAAGATGAAGASRVYMFHMDLHDSAATAHHAALSAAGHAAAFEAGVPGSEARHGLLPCSGGGGGHGSSGGPAGAAAAVDEMAEKMDALMDLTFQHIRARSHAHHLPQVYEALLRSFDSTILDTYKSKFTQFLLFFACSLNPASLAAAFASHLTDILTSPSRSLNSRMSAAAYLASFLARASFIPLMHIVSSLTRVVEWCLAHSHSRRPDSPTGSSTAASRSSRGREGRQGKAERAAPSPRASTGGPGRGSDGGGTGGSGSPRSQPPLAPSPQDHIFYAACQAVLYVLCYRMQHLRADSQANSALHAMPLNQLLSSHLCPLSVCLESVVFEFTRQAKLLALLDCDAITAAQQHAEHGAGSAEGGERAAARFGGENELDMFFPFDPYLLHHSLRFIDPIFNRWTQPFADELAAAEDEEADTEDEDEDEEEEEYTDDEEEESSSEGEDSAAERLGMSFSASDALPADKLMEQGLRAGRGAVACQGRGGGRGRGRGGPGVVHESDSEDEHEAEAMSFTPPAHAPLPARLPGKLPSRLR
ncbi:unnamed protein product [Closterium sp. Yama58-4]|nr:unnamed protein product [Closterium sp. Yama58-4]